MLSKITDRSVTRLNSFIVPGKKERVGTIRYNRDNSTFDICTFRSNKPDKAYSIDFPLKRYGAMFHTHPNACRSVDKGVCAYDPPSGTDIEQMTAQNEKYGTSTSIVFAVSGAYVIYFLTKDCCKECKKLPMRISDLQRRFRPGKRYNSEYKRLFKGSTCMDLCYFDQIKDTKLRRP